ncbi:glutamate/aspartate-rich protein [Natronomonas moolapensis 8.8.11]|uniref:Glutamate/aspartate-rich protein n=1 Tax=Natronomonas moolapensis (strain DSM 18674 / CECT 7526 / JCM 14361 / 8.8.11) TaxID=268739 RepID=M1Y0W5_NATM8|nr:hypothetical protein [Natronomonas moolapensis]CCQ36129.1 glutamate/aspartate-rich protein [Natronomonas moolapensis 8.8.11]
MRIPVPSNKLVAFTLIGALLTAGVAGALALPGGSLAQAGEQPNPGTTASDTPQQAASDVPTQNKEFTPAVQTQSRYEDEEHEDDEYEDDEHEDDEYEDDEYEDDEYEDEEHEDDEYEDEEHEDDEYEENE